MQPEWKKVGVLSTFLTGKATGRDLCKGIDVDGGQWNGSLSNRYHYKELG